MDAQQNSRSTAGTLTAWLNQADDYARSEPTKAVVSAFGAGFLINLLPIGAIVGAIVAVAFAMARPVLLFFGLLKVCELCRSKYNPTLKS